MRDEQADIFGGFAPVERALGNATAPAPEAMRLFEPAPTQMAGQLCATELAGMQDTAANADGENIERKDVP